VGAVIVINRNQLGTVERAINGLFGVSELILFEFLLVTDLPFGLFLYFFLVRNGEFQTIHHGLHAICA
jgi:hypothetical protein